MQASVDVLLEFWEVCVHAVLHSQLLYPVEIFEERHLYGLPVWQSRHPDVNAYIRRVLSNARPLLAAGLVRKLILNVIEGCDRSHIIQQICFDASLPGVKPPKGTSSDTDGSVQISSNDIYLLEEELRGCLLKLVVACKSQFQCDGVGHSWELNLVIDNSDQTMMDVAHDDTNDLRSKDTAGPMPSQDMAVDMALRSGEWAVDNTALPETIAKARQLGAFGNTMPESQSFTVKGFQTAVLGCNIYIQVHPSKHEKGKSTDV